jgi:cyclic dehypoxanthinyl futalosine synthase
MTWNNANVLDAFRGDGDMLEIGMLAHEVRQKLHPESVVTYEIRGVASSLEETCEEALLRGEGNVDLSQVEELRRTPLDILSATLAARHKQHPAVTFLQLSIRSEEATSSEALRDLCASGLRSIRLEFDPFTRVQISHPPIALLQSAASCELLVSANVTIGKGESPEQRIDMLRSIEYLQQQTGAIQAVLVRVHHASDPSARREEEATAVDYLKTLAITRIFLDKVPHMQTDWSVMGPKVLELALRFGADDAGAVPWSQAGKPEPSHHGGESELRRIIRDAGFRPVERDALFRQCLLR